MEIVIYTLLEISLYEDIYERSQLIVWWWDITCNPKKAITR